MDSVVTRSRRETPPSAQTARLPILEMAGIAALGAVIAIHTSELSGKVDETAYLGFGYVLLIAASIVSIALLAQRDVRGWILGGVTAAVTFIGYVLTRTTGLPKAHGDVGNWGETIGIWSLVAEGLVVLLAAIAVSRDRARGDARVATTAALIPSRSRLPAWSAPRSVRAWARQTDTDVCSRP